jgi:TPR repeat protein
VLALRRAPDARSLSAVFDGRLGRLLMMATGPVGERQWRLGDRLATAGNYRAAWRAFLRAARLGHASSQLNLGVLYSDGKGVRRSREKARYWFLKALQDPGSAPSAASNLGIVYLEQRAFGRARRWLEKAVALGDDDARLRLGQLLLAIYGQPESAVAEFRRLETSDSATVAGNEAGRTWRATTEGLVASSGGRRRTSG